ncbi:hypothetical protein SAY87_022518 [Trapa incisa]|uniref:Uncharacterized protein n=1 Tax=Trapa incisa TaxID=236973 RepID=A0AAN7K4E5_9MYRT|nr:hypothetical protein SAY87_022518 [Trapa incisa]
MHIHGCILGPGPSLPAGADDEGGRKKRHRDLVSLACFLVSVSEELPVVLGVFSNTTDPTVEEKSNVSRPWLAMIRCRGEFEFERKCHVGGYLEWLDHASQDSGASVTELYHHYQADKLTTSTFSTALGFWKGDRGLELWKIYIDCRSARACTPCFTASVVPSYLSGPRTCPDDRVLLKEDDLPSRIFPSNNVTNYDFNDKTGLLTIQLSNPCEVQGLDPPAVQSEGFLGYIEKGKVTNVEAMKTKMVWVKVTLVSVERPGKVQFTAGMKKSRRRGAYKTPRDGVVVDRF